MKTRILSVSLATSAIFAACEHGAPQPGPREMRTEPTPVETAPLSPRAGAPTSSEERPTGEARPTTVPMRHHDGPIQVAPVDAGMPLPNTTPPTAAVNAGPSAMFETRRNQVTTGDLGFLPPAHRMPVLDVPAQPMPAGPPGETQPSSVKPDGGILFDGGAPLPPIPDGGPVQTRDASMPL